MENLPNELEQSIQHSVLNTKRRNKKILFYFLGMIIFSALFYFFFLSAPLDFPSGSVARIEPGMSLRSVSFILKKEHLIRSRVVFESMAIILGGEKRLIAGDYYFENALPVYKIAWRIEKGEHHVGPIAVTIPEGFDLEQISNLFATKLANFDKNKFLQKTQGLEGYLFPDTYFFLSTDDETSVINSMSDNFKKKISSLEPQIIVSGKSLKDIIVMASIIEREAKGESDREIIAGILWHRIALGMPLGVDAAPETYKTKGLPKNPICNSGLESIKAAINPQSSPYLYYLHDKNGVAHYAKIFAEHNANIKKYLK